eukprot:752365-Hanusia_phi.AAC.6
MKLGPSHPKTQVLGILGATVNVAPVGRGPKGRYAGDTRHPWGDFCWYWGNEWVDRWVCTGGYFSDDIKDGVG